MTSRDLFKLNHYEQRLGLDDSHAAWLARLENACPSTDLQVSTPDALSILLAKLKVADEDAREIVRTMPSPESDPQMWWLLERSHNVLGHSLASRNNEPNWNHIPCLPYSLRLFPVHLILTSIAAIRQRQNEFGVSDDISWETLSSLGRAMGAYRREHGEAGINLTGWDWLRFTAWLYQVGRLEVTPYWLLAHPRVAGPLFWYDDETAAQFGTGHVKGAAALSIHIPVGDALTPEACDDSLRRMRTAFSKMQPDGPPRIATCTSWMLDEQLTEYLPSDSNILAFQRRFTMVPGFRENDDAILSSVFVGERPKDLSALPQKTTLERAVVEHLRGGCNWHIRTGWLLLPE